jgi:hypothetical protein
MRVLGPNFTVGLVVQDGRVTRAGPILKYVVGWSTERVVALARRRGWTITQQPEAGTCASSDPTTSRAPRSFTTAR